MKWEDTVLTEKEINRIAANTPNPISCSLTMILLRIQAKRSWDARRKAEEIKLVRRK